jgi:hypothetical protein
MAPEVSLANPWLFRVGIFCALTTVEARSENARVWLKDDPNECFS